MHTFGFKKDLVPLPISREHNFYVNVSLEIREILYIDETQKFIVIKYSQNKEWFNRYLTFKNLKNISRNIISYDERKNMWIPWISDVNTRSLNKCEEGCVVCFYNFLLIFKFFAGKSLKY